MSEPRFSNTDLARCAAREVSKRLQVYPRLVRRRVMTQVAADREIAMMSAISEHFTELANKEKPADLFGSSS